MIPDRPQKLRSHLRRELEPSVTGIVFRSSNLTFPGWQDWKD